MSFVLGDQATSASSSSGLPTLTLDDLADAFAMVEKYKEISDKVDLARAEMIARVSVKIQAVVEEMQERGGRPRVVWHCGKCFVVDMAPLMIDDPRLKRVAIEGEWIGSA